MRARNVKPGLFKNEILGEEDPALTILFVGLWCMADREGRLEDRPKKIKAEIFPYRNLDISGALTRLARHQFIHRYEIENQAFIQVLKFSEHQSPHVKEAKSKIPPPPENGNENKGMSSSDKSTELAQEQHQTNLPDSLIPDSLIPDSNIRGRDKSRRATRIPDDFELTIERLNWALNESKKTNDWVERQFEKFIDHFKSVPKSKALRSDWERVWKNWIRNAVDYEPKSKPNNDSSFGERMARKHGYA